jgi:hypothetical protein
VCDDDECQASAQRLLDSINDTTAPVFVASKCQEGSNIGSSETLAVRSCKCSAADETFRLIAATGGGGDCLAWGRGHLECVYPASEAQSCEPGEPHACDAICARLQQGYADDAALTYDATLRVAQCRSRTPGGDPAGGRCDKVVSINGSCYASDSNGFLGRTSYDCSLSDDEIFAQRDGL